MDAPVNTYETFKYNLFFWRILGVIPPEKYTTLYYIYSIFINVTVSVYYPLSLIIGIFVVVDSMKVLLEIMTLNITIFLISLKLFNIYFKRHDILKVQEYTKQLDARATDPEEQDILRGVMKKCRQYFLFYCTVYYFAAVTSEVAVLFSAERRIMYPAWFPFDWRASDTNYLIVHLYQLIGVSIQVTQNITSDTYPVLFIYVLCGHFKTMAIRIKKLGTDPAKSEEQHYQDLVVCLRDHLIILDYCKTVQRILSVVLFLQIFVSECVLCITAVYLLFIENIPEIIYISIYFCAMLMEIALVCYYGTELLAVSNEITESLYSCDWMNRDRKFKKALIIFMTNTQKGSVILAGNFIVVSLGTLLTVLQTTYSLYAVLHRMKSSS